MMIDFWEHIFPFVATYLLILGFLCVMAIASAMEESK